MPLLAGYLAALVLTFIAAWAVRPDYVAGFFAGLPNLDWKHFGLVLVIITFGLLTLGIHLAQSRRERADSQLPIGGLIAASSIVGLVALSAVFDLLWRVITPQLLLPVVIGIYAVNLGPPYLVYALKKSERTDSTASYREKEQVSSLRKVASEVERYAITRKLTSPEVTALTALLQKSLLSAEETTTLRERLFSLADSTELPESILVGIRALKI